MVSKSGSGQYSVKLTGPGVTFDRTITEEIAKRIINLVMVGDGSVQNAGSSSNAGNSSSGDGNQREVNKSGLTLKQFIAQKKPGNTYQRVACLAYFLTHQSNTPHFKTKDITKANTEAAGQKMTNSSVFVNDATSKYKYLSDAGKGMKQISTLGESIVDALPDQDKVKALQAENKSRARKRRKKVLVE